jgi:hypothetical protein
MLRNTLRHNYQTDLRILNTFILPKWEDVAAASSQRDNWRLSASGGIRGIKVSGHLFKSRGHSRFLQGIGINEVCSMRGKSYELGDFYSLVTK